MNRYTTSNYSSKLTEMVDLPDPHGFVDYENNDSEWSSVYCKIIISVVEIRPEYLYRLYKNDIIKFLFITVV